MFPFKQSVLICWSSAVFAGDGHTGLISIQHARTRSTLQVHKLAWTSLRLDSILCAFYASIVLVHVERGCTISIYNNDSVPCPECNMYDTIVSIHLELVSRWEQMYA
jgi:hypothetical protein